MSAAAVVDITTGPAATWQDQAACVGVGRDLFFGGHWSTDLRAKAICAVCPVRVACLTDQLAWERTRPQHYLFGVFGGLTGMERVAILAAERRHERNVA